MIKILGTIPRTHFHVAVSGGSDSMMLVDFLLRYPQNSFDVLHFNHGTSCCDEAEDFVKMFCDKHGLDCHVGKISQDRMHGESIEDFWRRNRYGFLENFKSEPILMAHHLNDCIETWVMTSMNGNPKLIPYFNRRYNIYRPLLCVPKTEIDKWCRFHNVEHVVDTSNSDVSIKRNYVRHVLMNHIRHINPGIETCVRKLILKSVKKDLSL